VQRAAALCKSKVWHLMAVARKQCRLAGRRFDNASIADPRGIQKKGKGRSALFVYCRFWRRRTLRLDFFRVMIARCSAAGQLPSLFLVHSSSRPSRTCLGYVSSTAPGSSSTVSCSFHQENECRPQCSVVTRARWSSSATRQLRQLRRGFCFQGWL